MSSEKVSMFDMITNVSLKPLLIILGIEILALIWLLILIFVEVK